MERGYPDKPEKIEFDTFVACYILVYGHGKPSCLVKSEELMTANQEVKGSNHPIHLGTECIKKKRQLIYD